MAIINTVANIKVTFKRSRGKIADVQYFYETSNVLIKQRSIYLITQKFN